MKKFILFFIFLIIINCFTFATTPPPEIHSSSAILIDARTGKVLFEKNSEKQSYPASTTKILTAYIALSSGFDLQTEIIPSKNSVMSVPAGSSIAYFSENEKLTLEQVLYGLMLPSGNDAANILAEFISGSNKDFAELMNKTANELGANNSHFVNPHGLHNDEHFTTAADLANIAMNAMKIEKFREIVSQSKYVMPKTNVSKTTRPFTNTNKLLLPNGEYFYPYATGIKTGYTTQAGNCLVSSAEKDGARLITVVLGGHNIPVGKSEVYIDTLSLFDYGFNNYHNEQLVSKNQIVTEVIPKRSKKEELNLIASSSIDILIDNNEKPVFEKIISLNEKIKAPIKKGDVLGTITYLKNNEKIGIVNLIAQKDIEKEHIIWVILRILLYFVVFVIILGVSLRIFNEIRKFLRRRQKKKGIR